MKPVRVSRLPPGARRVHLYPVRNVLNPRGVSCGKESLSERILEILQSEFEHWTDPEYGDNPAREELLCRLELNLNTEVRLAWTEFQKWAKQKGA